VAVLEMFVVDDDEDVVDDDEDVIEKEPGLVLGTTPNKHCWDTTAG